MRFVVELQYSVASESDAVDLQTEILNYVNKGLMSMRTELHTSFAERNSPDTLNEHAPL